MNRKSLGPLGPRKTLDDLVCERIREDIVNGALRPGESISTTEIARQLQISAMPVRAALTRLEAEGLVVIEPQRGVTVSTISPDDLEELFLMRSRLESLAAYLACPHLAETDLQKLRDLVEQMRQSEQTSDTKGWAKANERFHRTIFSATQRRRLTRMLSHLFNEGKRGRISLRNDPGHMRRRNGEHESILKALECKNAELAERKMQNHLVTAGKETAKFVAEQQEQSSGK